MKPLRLMPALFLIIVLSVSPLFGQGTRLLREPTVSRDRVAFVYANDIWVAPRDGGEARRITTADGRETSPHFSPDGSLIAFTGQYDGNTDVYVVPTLGGEPRRLTYHPGVDLARGWTRDGKKVLFVSGRVSVPRPYGRLWTVPVAGGMPQPLPMPMANRGTYSPDGKRMAYVPVPEAFNAWRHYRGGRTTPIWLIDLADFSVDKVPRENSNDTYPMWIGNTIYFLSDRNGTMNLFSYDLTSGQVKQLTRHKRFDIKTASAGDGVIVYEQAGYIHLFDPKTETSRQLEIEVRGDLPWARPHFVKVAKMIRNADLSPHGVRAVFEARGDIFTVPAKKGDARNLTQTPGVNDRYPAWSPDGSRIAWFSDQGGEYHLVIGDQKGLEKPRTIALKNPSFYYTPRWSPDSKKILFTDKHLNLWYLDVAGGKAIKVDTDTYSHPQRTLDPVWSPDSRWIAYAKRLDNHMHAIFLYSLDRQKSYQLSDGLSDAVSPAFDAGGKYLYFLASTDYALNTGWLDMTSYDRPVKRGIYLTVLSAEEPSPLLPESDEEKPEEAQEKAKQPEKKEAKGKKAEKKKAVTVRIDLEGIRQRILALKVPLREYVDLQAGAEGFLFYGERIENERGFRLHRYDLKKRKAETFLDGINFYRVSANGKKLLYRAKNKWGIVETSKKAKVGDGSLKTAQLEMKVDPRAEWQQIYLEAWRINRDFFYDQHMHGENWKAIYDKYQPFLKYVGHRSDLTYILAQLIGELTVGHAYVGGGDAPTPKRVPVGLLGADLAVENGRYRIKRIYTGENWNPDLRAPLTAPGIRVSVGDYLLEVNGRELAPPTNLYSAFEGTAEKQTVLRINSKPSLEGSWTVTVVPVKSETALRTRAWVEQNRRKVEEMSGGRLGYVYLPNTARSGYTYFNRYYFTQQDKQGMVIDERFNGGGSAADYMVDLMNRPLLNYWATRDGKTFQTPTAAVFGPKVMIINQFAGSGGDALPYYFRKRKIGPLVGKRTWGGLIGIYDYPVLIDGGFITAPRVAFYNTDGKWDVENIGIEPDIEVEQAPALVIQGRDPQLERAVQEALKLLQQSPPKRAPRPAPIDRTAWKRSS